MSSKLSDNNKLWVYSIYGLRLRSNLSIPNLMVATQSGIIDLDVTFTEVEQHDSQPIEAVDVYASTGYADNGLPFFKVWKNLHDPQASLGIQYTDGKEFCVFLVNQERNHIRVNRTQSMSIQDMLTYFLGPVIGCTLSLRQITCLHAGVVVVDGKALAIIGPKGAGKSTTTASLAHYGQAVLSDDIAALTEVNGEFMVAPGYLNLRLWPNTIDALSGISTDSLERVLSIAEKRFLDLSTEANAKRWRFHAQPAELAAVYVLNNRNQTNSLSITPLSRTSGLLKLAGNVYPEYSLSQKDRERDFSVLGKLATSVPVREVNMPDNIDSLTQVRDALLADFKILE